MTLTTMAVGHSATYVASNNMPFIKGGTLYIIAEFQDVVVKVEQRKDIKVAIKMEITAFDCKSRMITYEPAYEGYGKKEFVFLNQKKHRGEPSEYSNPNILPDFFGGQVDSGFYGTVTVTIPPGMSVSTVTSSGRRTLLGDLGDASLRFQTHTGRITVKGAADKISVRTDCEEINIHLSRPADTLECVLQKGSLSIDGVAHTLKVQTESAGVHMLLPQNLVLDGTFKTDSGGISSDFPASKSEGHHMLTFDSRDPDCDLTVATKTGHIAIRSDHSHEYHRL